jgi:hypothetical protein
MTTLDLFPVPEAARELGVTNARVRAMLDAGRLDGEKLGGRWLVYGTSIRNRQREAPARGRQLGSANAWAILFMASGEAAPWVTAPERSRLLRLLDDRGLVGLRGRFRDRAAQRAYRAHPGVLEQLAEVPGVVRTGISAAAAHGLDLVAGHEVDLYVRASEVPDIVTGFALTELGAGDGPGNVKLRAIPEGVWPCGEGVTLAPVAVTALDLSEDPDSRSERVGREALAALDDERRWRAVPKG